MGKEQQEYAVEKVLDKRFVKGKIQYFIKWKGWDIKDSTWEPIEHLNCPDLVDKFESEYAKKNSHANKEKNGTAKPTIKIKSPVKRHSGASSEEETTSPLKVKKNISLKTPETKKMSEIVLTDCKAKRGRPRKSNNQSKENGRSEKFEESIGFARNLKPIEIIAAIEDEGELLFLVKWENIDETDLVPAKEAHKKCPQLVIKFYEQRITWKNLSK